MALTSCHHNFLSINIFRKLQGNLIIERYQNQKPFVGV